MFICFIYVFDAVINPFGVGVITNALHSMECIGIWWLLKSLNLINCSIPFVKFCVLRLESLGQCVGGLLLFFWFFFKITITCSSVGMTAKKFRHKHEYFLKQQAYKSFCCLLLDIFSHMYMMHWNRRLQRDRAHLIMCFHTFYKVRVSKSDESIISK